MNGRLIIDDATDNDLLFRQEWGRGAEPRDFNLYPREMLAPPKEMEVIPRSEWSERIKEKKARASRVSDVRRRGGDNGTVIPHLDQQQMGYCWAHSTAHCVTLRRALDGMPYVPLSAYSVAAKIMNFRDRGGWCGLSLEFIRNNGIVPQTLWPNNMSQGLSRSLDNETNWNAAKHYRVTNEWVDLTASHYYYQRMTFDQVATALLNNEPCALDFNWWGHSVCGMDLVEVEPGDFGILILNSWAGWGDKGEAVLRGSRAQPDSAVAVRAVAA